MTESILWCKPYVPSDMVNFLYIARVMKEKGIDLYLACAKAIHDRYPNTLFHICGMCDDHAYLDIIKQAEEDGCILFEVLESERKRNNLN